MLADGAPAALEAFVRQRTAPAPVPLVPEIALWQATEVTALWHATAAHLEGWDDSPFWAFPWAGGQALARFLLDRPDAARGRTVLDFASGSGLVAVAAARAGASRVVAADVDPFCAAVLPLNAALNGVGLEVRIGSPLGEALPGFGLVLAGDVFYERDLAARGMAWFRDLARQGVRVLAGDPGRIYSPAGGAREIAAYDVPVSEAIEGRPILRARVLEILP